MEENSLQEIITQLRNDAALAGITPALLDENSEETQAIFNEFKNIFASSLIEGIKHEIANSQSSELITLIHKKMAEFGDDVVQEFNELDSDKAEQLMAKMKDNFLEGLLSSITEEIQEFVSTLNNNSFQTFLFGDIAQNESIVQKINDQISDQVNSVTQKINDQVNDAANSLNEKLESKTESVSDQINETVERINDAINNSTIDTTINREEIINQTGSEKKRRERGTVCCSEITRILKDILTVLQKGTVLERTGFSSKIREKISDKIQSAKNRITNYITRDNPIAQAIIKTNNLIQSTKAFLDPRTMFSRITNSIKEKLGIGQRTRSTQIKERVKEKITTSRRYEEMIKIMKECCALNTNKNKQNKEEKKEEESGFLSGILGGGGIGGLLSGGGKWLAGKLFTGMIGKGLLIGGAALAGGYLLKLLMGEAIDKTKELITNTTDTLKSSVPTSVASGLGLNTSSSTIIQKNIDNAKTEEEKRNHEKLLETLKEDKIRYEEAIKSKNTEEASAIRQKMNATTQTSRNISEQNNKSSTTIVSESITPTIKELNDRKIKIENSSLYSDIQKKEAISEIEKKITELKQFEGKELSQSESENVLKIYREMNRIDNGTADSRNTIKSIEKIESSGISAPPPISVSDPQSSITGDILRDVAKTEQEKSAGLMASLAGLMPGIGGGTNASSAAIGINHQNQTLNISTPPPRFNGLAAAVAMNS